MAESTHIISEQNRHTNYGARWWMSDDFGLISGILAEIGSYNRTMIYSTLANVQHNG